MAATPTLALGMIGLGRMGGNMAARLLAAGYPVYGEARHREGEQHLLDEGLRWCDTPREVARVADIVLTSLGMKSMANGIILRSDTVTAVECLQYALNLPTSVVITGCDSMVILEQALNAARTFRPMSDAQVRALLAKTKAVASKGEFEPFKTSSIFDSTATRPEWLGEEPQHVRELIDSP